MSRRLRETDQYGIIVLKIRGVIMQKQFRILLSFSFLVSICVSAVDASPVAKIANAKSQAKKAASGAVKSEAQAIAIVSARPEVKQFIANIKKNGRKGASSNVEFDRKENGEFVIHVYEYVPDDDETGHTATMNWYHVNAKTGKVTTEF